MHNGVTCFVDAIIFKRIDNFGKSNSKQIKQQITWRFIPCFPVDYATVLLISLNPPIPKRPPYFQRTFSTISVQFGFIQLKRNGYDVGARLINSPRSLSLSGKRIAQIQRIRLEERLRTLISAAAKK